MKPKRKRPNHRVSDKRAQAMLRLFEILTDGINAIRQDQQEIKDDIEAMQRHLATLSKRKIPTLAPLNLAQCD